MSRKWVTYFVLLSLLLLAIGGISQAQGSTPQGEGPNNVSLSVESVVPNGILYQGRLLDDGSPANGVYDFRFRLFDAQTGGHQIGGVVLRNNVRVRNGLFTVSLSFGSSDFTGDARWLQVEVRPGTSTGSYTVLTPRQPIYPVPYALSLRPGATIRDNTSSVTLNSFYRLLPPASLSWKYGIEASSNGSATNTTYIGVSGKGRDIGVYGESSSADGYGGKFVNTASGGVGLYAQAKEDADADLVLGGTAGTKDNGVLSSDPRYPSSDIVIRSNDNVRIDLDADGNGEDADFEIRNKDGDLIFNVDESGAVISALPRPAYDSGWRSISPGRSFIFLHNLRSNPDNYVVDMTCKSDFTGMGINQLFFGGDYDGSSRRGAYWRHLTSTTITVYRFPDDDRCNQVRVRIWVYK